MTGLAASPALLMAAVLALLGGSLIVLVWGRRIPREGDWLVSLGLLSVLVVSGIGWSLVADQGFAPQEWSRGWIWPRDEAGAITVGVLRDTLGLSLSILSALVAASFLFGAGAPARESRPGRFYSSLGLSAGGVALAWFAVTPWLSLTGNAIVVLGGFLALGSRWEGPGEAKLATRFGWERSWGLLMLLLGLCVLAGGRPPLSMLHGSGAGAWASQAAGVSFSDQLGAAMLFLGAFAQLQPFPFLGWVMTESDTYCSSRVVLTQVFPAWAVFALLLRLEPQLRDVGIFPNLGWVALVSSVLAAAAGVFSNQWRLSLGAWVSAGFSLVVAALAFAGPAPALCLAIGVGLGASALAGFAGALEEGGPASSAARQRALWAKVGCALAAAAGTGVVGFVSSGGSVHAVSLAWGQPVLIGAVSVVFFLYVFLGWKVAWQAMATKNNTQAPWAIVLAPYLLILLALGVTWTGTLSGGAIPGNPDRIFSSLLTLFFGQAGEAWGEDAAIGPASGLYWMLVAVAASVAYWTAGRRPDFWPSVTGKAPRLSAFVTSGYGVDSLVSRVRDGLAWAGAVSVRFFDRNVWESWIPGLLGRGARRGAAAVAAADLQLSRGIGGMLKSWVEAPSKALQLIQNGDVQWYLFFAVGSGIAILAHFMTKT